MSPSCKVIYRYSKKLDANAFARIVRSHLLGENGLHWVLDVVFRDDLARLRSGNGPANMAIVKHAAMNLLTQAKAALSSQNRRKRAGWNQDYLDKSSGELHETFMRFAVPVEPAGSASLAGARPVPSRAKTRNGRSVKM